MIKKNEMKDLLVNKGWYFEVNSEATFITQIEPKDISKYISMDELNEFTRARLGEMYNDPSNDSYYTPQQLAKINIERMIEDNDIGGSIYNTKDGKLLELECDSDTYRLAVKWFINLDKLEGIIS